MSSDSSPETTYPQRNNSRAAVESSIAAVSFATMAALAHGFHDQLAWPIVAFARVIVGLVLALVMMRAYRAPLLFRGTKALWARTVSGAVGLMCTFYSLANLPVTDTISIFAMSPIWIAVILAIGFGERISRGVWFYAALALGGVYVMQRPTFDAESFPILVAVFGSVVVAVVKVSLSRCADLHPLSVVTHHMGFTTLVTLLLCLMWTDTLVLDPELATTRWLWLIPVGLIGTVAQVFMTMAYAHGNTTMVALVGLSNIAVAAVYDVLIWDRAFDALHVVGVLMIAASIAMSLSTSAREARAAAAEVNA
ncbi:MAG: DMT family transporter [Candidatus Hydrogenedentes bacterium]|nr:DMT family transporter [Candidatus Hydrogenedentota bacterium]